MVTLNLVQAAYIVAAVLFVLSLAGLSKHETAKQGNAFGVVGMVLALVATVWSVLDRSPHALHTPLMSETNAISGIILVGGLLQVDSDDAVVKTLALLAITVATVNNVGGFAVTGRMLQMFRKD